MYEVSNMGCGFCCVVPSSDAEAAVELLARHHRGVAVIGAVTDEAGTVELPSVGLVGRADSGFTRAAAAS
jgi:phosphoribosylaminoimidazole (AIR) synthetase